MASCARATRGLGRPSLNTRSGSPSSPPSRKEREKQRSLDVHNGKYASPLTENRFIGWTNEIDKTDPRTRWLASE